MNQINVIIPVTTERDILFENITTEKQLKILVVLVFALMDCFFSARPIHTTFQILSSDDRPAGTTLAREHRALHAAVYPRCGNCLHERDRSGPVQQQPGDPKCAGS
jgi:hypothetical protein